MKHHRTNQTPTVRMCIALVLTLSVGALIACSKTSSASLVEAKPNLGAPSVSEQTLDAPAGLESAPLPDGWELESPETSVHSSIRQEGPAWVTHLSPVVVRPDPAQIID